MGLEFATGDRCASFDGDADRLMYFYKDNGNMGPKKKALNTYT